MMGEPNHQSEGETKRKASRNLRRSYRELIKQVEATKLESINDSELLKQHVETANSLFKNATNSSDMSLDSKFLLSVTEIALEKSKQSAKSGSLLNHLDFLSRIKSKISNRDDDGNVMLDWTRLNEYTSLALARKVSRLEFMLGPLSIVPKVAAPRKMAQRQQAPTSALQKPKELGLEDVKLQENETMANVNTVYRRIEELERVNLFVAGF